MNKHLVLTLRRTAGCMWSMDAERGNWHGVNKTYKEQQRKGLVFVVFDCFSDEGEKGAGDHIAEAFSFLMLSLH